MLYISKLVNTLKKETAYECVSVDVQYSFM